MPASLYEMSYARVAKRRAVSRGVLIRYRVMAYLTAIFLLVLVFVAVPLQVWGHRPAMAEVVGQIHGVLYMIYLVSAFEITVKLRIPLVRLVLVLLAGTIPFGSFVAERKMTHAWEANQRVAGEESPAPAPVTP